MFPHPPIPYLGPTQPPIQWTPRLYPWGKAAGAGPLTPAPSIAEVKERVELYHYTPLSLNGRLCVTFVFLLRYLNYDQF
jgi:hypothetical protein